MNQVCHSPQGLSNQQGCQSGDEVTGSNDNGEQGPRPGEGPKEGPGPCRLECLPSVHRLPAQGCTGRGAASWLACWGVPFSFAPDCQCFLDGWPSPKDMGGVAQRVVTFVRLTLGWMPTGHFWGRVELKEASRGPFSGSVLRSSHEWPRRRGAEGDAHRWESGTVLVSPCTVSFGSNLI